MATFNRLPSSTSSLAHVADVSRLAAGQHQAVADFQLRDMGIGRDWVQRAVAAGVLVPALAGTYTFGADPANLPRDTCAMIGVLQTSGIAALTGVSALEYMGLWTRSLHPIQVATPNLDSATHVDVAPGIDIVTQRTRLLAGSDIVTCRDMPCVGSAIAIMRAGQHLTPMQTASVIWKSAYDGDLDVDELRSRLEFTPRARWSASAREALEWHLQGSSGTKSRSEDRFHELVVGAGLRIPLVNVLGAAGIPGHRPDFVWSHERVIVEIDGRHHNDMPMIAEHDRALDEVLRRAGWTVIRIPYRRVWNDPHGVVALVARALGV